MEVTIPSVCGLPGIAEPFIQTPEPSDIPCAKTLTNNTEARKYSGYHQPQRLDGRRLRGPYFQTRLWLTVSSHRTQSSNSDHIVPVYRTHHPRPRQMSSIACTTPTADIPLQNQSLRQSPSARNTYVRAGCSAVMLAPEENMKWMRVVLAEVLDASIDGRCGRWRGRDGYSSHTMRCIVFGRSICCDRKVTANTHYHSPCERFIAPAVRIQITTLTGTHITSPRYPAVLLPVTTIERSESRSRKSDPSKHLRPRAPPSPFRPTSPIPRESTCTSTICRCRPRLQVTCSLLCLVATVLADKPSVWGCWHGRDADVAGDPVLSACTS